MAAILLFDVDHAGPVVRDSELPSEYVALAVYCAVCPEFNEVGPVTDKPVSDGGAAMFRFTVIVTLEPAPVTTNDAVWLPAATGDGKLTVTLPVFTPFVGETRSQFAVGTETDHFSALLPVLLMFTLEDGGVEPATP